MFGCSINFGYSWFCISLWCIKNAIFIMTATIKIILSILLLLCLLDMPYGYYQLVRFVGLIGFALLGYQAYQQGKQTEMIIYIGLALLFQPLFKIALGREIWNIVDVIIGIGLILSIWISPKKAQR